jgi:serine/threonine protein kinase/Leucine-rich repeat (LRR) protein
MVESNACPTADALQRLLAGGYPEAEARRLEEHLARCFHCLATLRTLRPEDEFAETARKGAGVTEILSEPVDPALLVRLYRLGPARTGGCGSVPGEGFLRAEWKPHSGPPREALLDFLAPPEAPNEIGRLAGYRVLKLLGAGGMGMVLEAEDTRLQRRVALKVMRPSLAAIASARKQFLREARALAAIRHDHVVPIYEVGEDGDTPFLVMPLLQGESLERQLRRVGRLPVAEVLRIGREAAEGLAAAHARALIHRDMKPANVWLEATKETPKTESASSVRCSLASYRVQLLDFGLARSAEGQESVFGGETFVGTPAYMSPEQARGETLDLRSDLFGLGTILYRMATGKLPFKEAGPGASPAGQPEERVSSPHDINPDVPLALSELILQLLSRDPLLRPASAEEVAHRLRAIEQQLVEQPPAEPAGANIFAPAMPAPRTSFVRTGRRWVWAAVLGCAVLLPLGYFFGGAVFRFATNQGQVVIEVNDPDTEVTLKEAGAVIQDRKGQRQVTLAAGKHELEVTVEDSAGEVRFFTTTFQLRRGGKEIVRVREELAKARPAPGTPSRAEDPSPKPAVLAAEAERKAALWALLRGAEGTITIGDRKMELSLAEGLQAGVFQVVHLTFGPESKLSEVELNQFDDLPNLRRLKLQGEWVTDATLSHLKALKNLQRLDLIAWKVSDAGLSHLQGLTNLDHLIVMHAPITDAGVIKLQALPNLRNLEIDGARLTEAGADDFRAFPSLTRRLTLNNDGMTDDWLGRLKTLTRLNALAVASNPIGDAGLLHLKALRNLEFLDLSYTKISDAGLVHLRSLAKLHQVHLTGTRVSDTGVANLKGLPSLAYVDLSGTRVTDACLAHLVALAPRNKFTLYLRGVRVSARGIADLHEALPKAVVEWWEPNRAAAEAVLNLGGSVHVRCANEPDDRLVKSTVDLPREYFRLRRASLASIRKPLGSALANVPALVDPQFDDFESLDLSNSAVTDADLVYLERLTQLRRLVLDGTGVRVAGLAYLKGLIHLTELRLGCPDITDLGAGVVGELKGLERLSLAGSGLTDRGLEAFKELEALRELDLTNTRVSARSVAVLQSALPRCRILTDHAAGK